LLLGIKAMLAFEAYNMLIIFCKKSGRVMREIRVLGGSEVSSVGKIRVGGKNRKIALSLLPDKQILQSWCHSKAEASRSIVK
jgi:hypothetical protein